MEALVSGIKFFFIDLVSDLVRWPIWWYSRGLLMVINFARNSILNFWRSLAIGVWVKNIFVPMYGTRDWASRLISFFVRVVQIIARTVAWLLYCLLIFLGLLLYIIALPLVVIGLVDQIFGLFIG